MDSYTFSGSWSARWALSVGLALSTPIAFSQEPPLLPAPKLKYTSVFSQYQGFKEQPVSPWRQTNDVVEKIGGWRVYAKEASLPEAADKAVATPDKPKMHGEPGSKP